MISPSIDGDAVAARLDRLPIRLRDALARELDRIARSRTAGVPPALSLSIDATADAVTLTIASTRFGTAGLWPALPAGRRRSRTSSRHSLTPPVLAAIAPQIRSALEVAARQALAE